MDERETTAADPVMARAVAEVGDSWTLLITWAIAAGVTRFDALQRELGVARNILSERLRRQMRAGLVEKRPIAEGARRMEYRQTAKGVALADALGAIREWASTWSAAAEAAPPAAQEAPPAAKRPPRPPPSAPRALRPPRYSAAE